MLYRVRYALFGLRTGKGAQMTDDEASSSEGDARTSDFSDFGGSTDELSLPWWEYK